MFQKTADFHSKFVESQLKLCTHVFVDCSSYRCNTNLFSFRLGDLVRGLILVPVTSTGDYFVFFFCVLFLRLTSCIQLFHTIWFGSEFQAAVMCLQVLRSTWNMGNVGHTLSPTMFWDINILHPSEHKHFSSMVLPSCEIFCAVK